MYNNLLRGASLFCFFLLYKNQIHKCIKWQFRILNIIGVAFVFLKLAVSPEIFVNLEEKYIHQYEKIQIGAALLIAAMALTAGTASAKKSKKGKNIQPPRQPSCAKEGNDYCQHCDHSQ